MSAQARRTAAGKAVAGHTPRRPAAVATDREGRRDSGAAGTPGVRTQPAALLALQGVVGNRALGTVLGSQGQAGPAPVVQRRKSGGRTAKNRRERAGSRADRLRQLAAADGHYDYIEQLHQKEWPRLQARAKKYFTALLEFLEVGQQEVQSWVKAENEQQILNFEKSHVEEAIGWAKDELAGALRGKILEKLGPGGKALGLALSFATKMAETSEHNERVNEAAKKASYASDLGIEGSGLVFEILTAESSALYLAGGYDRAGQHIVDSQLRQQREDLDDYRNDLAGGRSVPQKHIDREVRQAEELKDEFVDLQVGFYRSVQQLGRAMANALPRMRTALNDIKIAFAQFVAEKKGVELTGVVRRQGAGYVFAAQLWKLGDEKWTKVSRETSDYLKTFDMSGLSKKMGAVTASIDVIGKSEPTHQVTFAVADGGTVHSALNPYAWPALRYIGEQSHGADGAALAVMSELEKVLRTTTIGDLSRQHRLPR